MTTVRQGQPLSTDPERRLDPYVPRVLLRHLAEAPDERVRTVDASMVFADISGFTALSERLARAAARAPRSSPRRSAERSARC